MKHNEKFKRLSLLCASLALLLCAPLGLAACSNSNDLTVHEKAELIINATSAAISNVDDEIMQEYENSQGSVETSAISPLNNDNVYAPHKMFDRGSNMHARNPVSQMTITFGYYALSEYYQECIPNFIDKTLFVKQTYYQNQKIWSKCELTDNTLEIHIWTEYENSFDEYINITIEYSKNYKATKFTHRENRHCVNNNDYFGCIQVDFQSKGCVIETITTHNKNSLTDEIDYKQESDANIKADMQRYIREEFNFNKYKKRTTYVYESHNLSNISEEQMIAYAREFNYAYTRDGKPNFDFENAEDFDAGNTAMDYAFDKYLIIEDIDNGTLKRLRPKKPNQK